MKYRLAADIGATRTTFALIEVDSPHIVAHDRPYTEQVFPAAAPVGRSLADAARRFLDGQRVAPADVIGMGVGVPGLVNQRLGHVLACPNLRLLDDTDLARAWGAG